jgi:hypothetical protein
MQNEMRWSAALEFPASSDKDEFKDDTSVPFYNAITASAIVQILFSLDSGLNVSFEDYQ